MSNNENTIILLFDCGGLCNAVFPRHLQRYLGLHIDEFAFRTSVETLDFRALLLDEHYWVETECENGEYQGDLHVCCGEQAYIMVSLQRRLSGYHQLSYAERLQTIINSTRAGTWEWNYQTGEVILNERWAQIIGYTLEELSPISIETWLEFAHPDDIKRSNSALERHFCGDDEDYLCEVRLKHKDGHWVWVRDCGRVATRTVDNQPEWITGTHIDISARINTINELQQVRNELNSIIDSLPAAVFKSPLNRLGHFTYMSVEVERITGYNVASIQGNSHWWLAQIHPEDREALQAEYNHWLAQGARGVCKCDYRFRHSQGHYVWLCEHSQRLKAPKGNNGAADALVGSLFDKTENMSLHTRMDALAQIIPGMIYQFVLTASRSWHFLYASEGVKRIFEVTPEQALQNPARMLSKVAHGDRENMLEEIVHSAAKLEDFECEFKVTLSVGYKWLFAHAIPQRQTDGGIMWTGMVIDITERKLLELRLRKESTTDPLTGLYNRRYFFEQLQLRLDQAVREEQTLALIILDLDLFKQINDNFGHHGGDLVLQTVAQLLNTVIRKYDIVARIGGEEFAIILPNTTQEQGVHVAEKIREKIAHASICINQELIEVTATLGVSSTEYTKAQVNALFKQADLCLYRGKRLRRNCVISNTL
ncbi:GGDEF domain-containing protein [Pseudoalteromonas sp. T1lg75]|uniref:GGDEF domain-containing protein n=1 Tax=Pseudoalteromonas sp. T1lg75 TaxID=2077102 RepID=UPI000CF6AAE8|nr:sensor domain-containing diguanylate cyclase [Pseudoalteromonas sp. T1lg75]